MNVANVFVPKGASTEGENAERESEARNVRVRLCVCLPYIARC